MKKLLCALLCVICLVSLAACGSPAVSTESQQDKEPISMSEPVQPNLTEGESTNVSEPKKEENIEASTPGLPTTDVPDGYSPDITFTTTDRDGNEWTEKAFAGHKLTMINFWETWCHGCVEEMPDINKLYESYKDQGFLVLGVYGSDTTVKDEEVAETIKTTGVTYPNLRYCKEFSTLLNDMYPTTVFVDENGKIVGETIIGSRSYVEWVKIIEGLL